MNANPIRRVCGWHFGLQAVMVCGMLVTGIDRAQGAPPPVRSVTLVDIIPESLSGEKNMNCEPNLTVDPADPSRIAASARLPEPMGRKMSVVFISTDGGTTWSCRSDSSHRRNKSGCHLAIWRFVKHALCGCLTQPRSKQGIQIRDLPKQ